MRQQLDIATKFFVPFVASLLIFGCSVKQSVVDKLKPENDSLVQALEKKESHQLNVHIDNTLIKELTSQHTNEVYDIYISFPHDYKNSGKKYPLLVVLDAEVNFGAVTYIAQRLIKDELIPELFIVGIAYKGETDEETYYAVRGRDFTPTSDTSRHYKFGSGGAENFAKFISDELFPFLDNNYPLGNESKTIYGHSFGGLFATHVLLNHPTLFDNYLVLSPSLWWDHGNILKDVKPNSFAGPVKLYMGTGSLEISATENMVADHLEMVDRLKGLDHFKMKSEILDHETHRTVFGRGFTNGLRFIYSKE